ncbi:serine/threonine protein kinase [Candidatus Uabimicrobium amorphum]|uniref:Protein kinase n=1 Tax=Uabimicrobium amorphum TaxID=2596890 RepID=A0A5S9F331_UABAM|nr:serine/threonine-protein kinase [Candidatus Uabimicrobium amorphum]BBM84068.1 protein kinase [Candidatus Uabimicrobium amorphum]
MINGWFVKSNRDGKVVGPYSLELVKRYIKEGKIKPGEHIISQDSSIWRNIDYITNPNASKTLGKYRLLEELGRGGMGVVYRAFDAELQRECALKVLLSNSDNDAIERFKREAIAIAKIRHPNIIQIYEVHQKKPYFFAMTYIDGLPLDQYISNLDLKERLHLFHKICTPIAFAHQQGILHRDLKPANILISKEGEPVIVDFGIAKDIDHTAGLTKTGAIVGTPIYIPPEVIQGKPVDQRSDVYSLGVILYKMLTGRVPFFGENAIEIMMRTTSEDPIPPSVLNTAIAKNSDLEIVCLATLEKKQRHRVSSVEYLQTEIDNILHQRPISLKPPKPWEKLKKWCKNHPIHLLTLLSLTAITSVAFVVAYNLRRHSVEVERQATKIIMDAQQREVAAIQNAIDITLETLKTETATQHIFTSFAKIQLCYQYLYQIQDKISQEQTKSIYRKLNSHLRFSILSKFPNVVQKTIPINGHSICSNDGKYIATLSRQNKRDIIYIWKNEDGIPLTTDNIFYKIYDASNTSMRFSPNNKFIVYKKGEKLTFFDLQQKKQVFTHPGSIRFIKFSQNYCAFYCISQRRQALLNLRTLKVEHFALQNFCPMMISPNEKWLVIHHRTQQKFLIYNIQNKSLQEYTNSILGRECHLSFCDNENKIFIVGLANVGVFNIAKRQLTTAPSSLFSKRLAVAPISTMPSYFAIGKKDGKIVLVKQSINDSISHETFPNYSNVSVSQLTFVSPTFLTVEKNKIIEIHDMYAKNPILIFDEGESIRKLHALEKDGLRIVFTKSQSYNEYRFPFQKLNLSANMKKIMQSLNSFNKNLNPMQGIIADGEDVVVYIGRLGFAVWKKGKPFYKSHLKDAALNTYRKKSQQLFTYSQNDGVIDIYNVLDGSLAKKVRLNRQNNLATAFELSRNEEILYIATQLQGIILKYDLGTQSIQKYSTVNGIVRKIIELQNGNLLVVSLPSNVHIVQPNGDKVRIPANILYPSTIAVNHQQTFFAVGSLNGEVLLYKNASSPQLYHTAKVHGEVQRMSFSPNGDYLAVFVGNHIYIYDVQNPTDKFEMYTGYYKAKGMNFNNRWSKAYIANAIGEVMVFDQAYIFDKQNLRKKIRQCEKIIPPKNDKSLVFYMNRIEEKIQK